MSTSLNQVLDAVDMALGVIKTVADTPGVNLLPYAAVVSSSVSAIKAAETAGRNIAPYVMALSDTFSGGVPTLEQIAALDAKIIELDALVEAPLPPKEENEPD